MVSPPEPSLLSTGATALVGGAVRIALVPNRWRRRLDAGAALRVGSAESVGPGPSTIVGHGSPSCLSVLDRSSSVS